MVMNRFVVGVLAGLVMAAVAAVPAAGAPATHTSEPPARESRRTAVAERLPTGPGTFVATPGERPQRDSVTSLLTGVATHRDLDAWLGSIATAITATSGGPVATATAPQAGEDPDEPVEDVPYSGRFAETYPAGDLDGDGHGDVVTYHWDVQTWRAVLEGRRGDTGALLWERAEDADGGLAWPLGHDLSGDGTADLLVFDLEILTDNLADCDWEDDECWSQPWEATFAWTVGLVSGSDGQAVWTRSLDGWIMETVTETSGSPAPMVTEDQYSYGVDGENLDVLPFVGDLDGDGLPEVILNAIDVSERFSGADTYVGTPLANVGSWQGGYELESTTRVNVIEAGGTTERVLASAAGGRVALLWPLDQPDGSSDAVWEHSLYPETRFECVYADAVEHCPVEEYGEDAVELVLLDGQTFTEEWSTSIGGYGLAWPAGGDLDADGRNDLVAWTLDFESFEDRTRPLSGATGQPLWDDGIVIRDVLTVGPLNSAAGDDVIAIDFPEPPDPLEEAPFTVAFQRRDGRTGALLHETRYTATSEETDDGWSDQLLYATAGADGTGDGAPDLTVGTITLTEHETEDSYWFEISSSSAVAESGASGEPLYTTAGDGLLLLGMADDFDGDGLAEAAEEIILSGEAEETVTLTTRRLTDTGALWTDEATGAFVFHTWGGDVDGDGASELYRHVDSVDAGRRVSTLVTALDGPSGATRWSLTSRE
jgi:hypothetical protein